MKSWLLCLLRRFLPLLENPTHSSSPSPFCLFLLSLFSFLPLALLSLLHSGILLHCLDIHSRRRNSRSCPVQKWAPCEPRCPSCLGPAPSSLLDSIGEDFDISLHRSSTPRPCLLILPSPLLSFFIMITSPFHLLFIPPNCLLSLW